MTQTSEELVKNLLKWFHQNKRWMPWRETKNPYYIWISEVMLQQTKVETVIDYYNKFISKFETIEDLANASEEEVLKCWEGLGYYSRGRNLRKAAKMIIENYGGILPSEYKALIRLPGIGPYTAGAILSIAYNKPVAAIDGNVMRVYSRIYHIKEDILLKETVDKVRSLVEEMMPEGNCNDFSEALMELGALNCTPKNPNCEGCPLNKSCLAFNLGIQDTLPNRINKTKVSNHYKIILCIENEDEILMKKNNEKGLLSGMWVLPTLEIEKQYQKPLEVEKVALEKYENLRDLVYLGGTKHIFTHQKWEIVVYGAWLRKNDKDIEGDYEWVSKNRISSIPLPTIYQKVMGIYETQGNKL